MESRQLKKPMKLLATNVCMFSLCIFVHLPGFGINLGMRGLESVGTFIYRTATAVDQNDILEALSAKMQHSRQVAEAFKHTGLTESMYEWQNGTVWWMLSAI